MTIAFRSGTARHRSLRALLAAGALSLAAGAAHAQTFDSTLLVPTTAPPDFNRDRNVSVTERPRPDYDPLGIRLGGFNLFPRLGIGAGYTSNAFLNNDDNKRDSAFISVMPSIDLRSDWSVNELRLQASGQFDRYIQNSLRNQSNWSLRGTGRLDVDSDDTITADAQVARVYESPFSGDVNSDVAVLSNYLRAFGSLRGQRAFGRFRASVSIDDTDLTFNRLELRSGVIRSQADRDRNLLRGVGQLEYAWSPSVALFGQVSYVTTDYDRALFTGDPNRDSNAVRALVGTTVDIAGRLRGRLGVGYTFIDYNAPVYGSVSGLSAEGQIEFFPTELTTVTLRSARTFQDANVAIRSTGNTALVSSYIDTRASLRVDHELLRNLILGASTDLAHQNYIGSPLKNTSYRLLTDARYLASRLVELNASVSYLRRNSTGNAIGGDFDEFRFVAGIVLHR